MSQSQQYKDVLPLGDAETLRTIFVESVFPTKTKQGPLHYSTELVFDGDAMPKANEVYSTRYGRCNKMEESKPLKTLVRKHIIPLMGIHVNNFTLRAYRLDAGDHFRIHSDHTLGDMSFAYYLSKDWVWDWGGLLVTIENGEAKSYLPEFNSLVVMDAKARVPHFVTQVAPWALEPRYMLAGFCK